MARRNRFVSVNVVRLPLTEGDWIEVKERLSYEEQEALNAASMKPVVVQGGGSRLELELGTFNIQRIMAWVVDWSFVGPDDKVPAVSRITIGSLDPLTANEITAALDTHIAALTAVVLDPTGASADVLN